MTSCQLGEEEYCLEIWKSGRDVCGNKSYSLRERNLLKSFKRKRYNLNALIQTQGELMKN